MQLSWIQTAPKIIEIYLSSINTMNIAVKIRLLFASRRVEDVCSQYQVNNQTSNNSLQDLISQVW